jgi:hypothetical protein
MQMRSLAAACLVVASFFAQAAPDDPVAVYAEFHRAALRGDARAMARLSTAAQQARMNRSQQPEEEARRLSELLPRSYHITGRAIGAKRAVLNLRGLAGPALEGAEIDGKIILVRQEGGTWKVEEPAWSAGAAAYGRPAKPQPGAPAAAANVDGPPKVQVRPKPQAVFPPK